MVRHAVGSGAGSSAHAEMRRSTSGAQALRKRFLRPRGDAPDSGHESLRFNKVPPPTRRCAGPRRAWRRSHGGSSAHAEMRLIVWIAFAQRLWFLRPRGDAPTHPTVKPIALMVPPPTRRCAVTADPACDVRAGSSAHAEMRLRARNLRPDGRGFLRPRGDAPTEFTTMANDILVPPPTRRCAAGALARNPLDAGSSAHAEMRRLWRSPRASRRGFLRPRGDAPVGL